MPVKAPEDHSINCRPDGTPIANQHRPDLYEKLSVSSSPVTLLTNIPKTANVAIFATYKANEEAIDDVCHYIENNLSEIIQLPELFFIADKSIMQDPEQRIIIQQLCELFITQVSQVLRPYQYVCTSLILNGAHKAVIINNKGLFATQGQLHFCRRYKWTDLTDEFSTIELPVEQGFINVAMLTADDANIAKMFAFVGQHSVQLVLVPFDIQEPSEVEKNLISQAELHQVCIVAATREKKFKTVAKVTSNNEGNPFAKNKVKEQKSTGLIINLPFEQEFLPQWQPAKPKQGNDRGKAIIKHQFGKITKAVIHPISTYKNNEQGMLP